MRVIVAIVLAAFLLAGCAPLVCWGPPQDYDMCAIHCYSGKCTR